MAEERHEWNVIVNKCIHDALALRIRALEETGQQTDVQDDGRSQQDA